jgi:hypothetical protein
MGVASSLSAVFRRLEHAIAPTPKADPYDCVVVVFTRPEQDLSQFDIALGPCIPRPKRSRPFVGITNQTPGEPSMFEALARILLPDQDATAWQAVAEVGEGRLATFSVAIVAAMAALNRENLRRQAERPKDYDWVFEPERAIVNRWLPDVQWFVGSDTVPGPAAWFGAICAWARVGQDRGDNLYCWSGPGFNPWTTSERIERLGAKAIGDRPTV